MKIIVLILIVVAILVAAGWTTSRPISIETAEKRIAGALRKTVGKGEGIDEASIRVVSESRGIDVLARADADGADAFHVASVGKLFTAAIVGSMVDEAYLSFDDPAVRFLPEGTLDGLFVVDGTDHQHDVTVAHLLGHTSGAADYYEDANDAGTNGADLILAEPHRRWNADDILAYAREHTHALAAPGEVYHYSDTGYIILGRIVEELLGTSFEEAVHSRIFAPLGMTRSWFVARTSPAEGPATIRPVYLGGTDVSTYPSITLDWAGGGIASTEGDLLRFAVALKAGRIVSPETLERMHRFDHEFMRGIGYGLGFMEYRFGDFFFLLKNSPAMVGHMGILGTQLFYDPDDDLFIVISLGSDETPADSVRLLIQLMGLARRVPAEKRY